jgi:hypothetical protein
MRQAQGSVCRPKEAWLFATGTAQDGAGLVIKAAARWQGADGGPGIKAGRNRFQCGAVSKGRQGQQYHAGAGDDLGRIGADVVWVCLQ